MDTKLISFLFFLLLCSCINDDLDECPPEVGNIKINIYAEKFQNKSEDPLASREASFNTRLHHLYYYLYKGDKLLERGSVDDLSANTAPAYSFERSNLDFGDYTLLVLGNCKAAGVITGTGDNRNELILNYPGIDTTDDFFTCVFPFTVNCDCTQEYDAGLQRVHGVIRCNIVNLPENISDVEISINGLSGKKTVTGNYSGNIEVSKRFPVVNAKARTRNQSYVLGTFPTANGQQSAYRLKLYSYGSDVPILDKVIADTLTVQRNQLLDMTTTFDENGINGNIRFEILLGTEWDGSVDGGSTDIH